MSSADPYRQAPQFPPPPAGPGQPVWPQAPQPVYPQQMAAGPYAAQPYGAPATPQFPGVPQQSYPQPAYPQPVYPQPVYPQPVAYQQPPMPQLPPMPQAPAPLPLSAQPVSQPFPQPAAKPKPVAPRPVPVSAAPKPAPAAAPANAPAAKAANRPVPAPARPILVDKSKEDAKAPKVSETENQEPPPDVAQKAARRAPPWLVSMVIHMVFIIILALLTIPPILSNQVEITVEQVWAETLGKQVLEDTLQSPESLDMKVDSPALSFDTKPADDPLAAPPMLPDLVLDANTATDSIPAPSIGLALNGREAGAKRALLAAYGGNATTESAVIAGLEWLKKQQAADGSWSITGPYPDGGAMENKLSATAMALLAFQGYGSTHKPNPKLAGKPDFHNEVRKGWDYLLKTQTPDGFFNHDGGPHQKLYAQAQASIAICEIYGMTKDEKFKKPAQLALDYAFKAQAPEGGWRYEPKYDSDTSVTGWFVMALQSGIMAGLEVPSPNLDSISKFFDSVAKGDGSQYAYQPGREATIVMTAEALLCRQYLGWKHDDPRMQAGINMLLLNKVDYGDQNVYYWYYATQACHHMGRDSWQEWNNVMKQAVPTAQLKTGNDKGSWSPSGDRWGSHGGRLYVTCLSIYMLETYYRHNFVLQ